MMPVDSLHLSALMRQFTRAATRRKPRLAALAPTDEEPVGAARRRVTWSKD